MKAVASAGPEFIIAPPQADEPLMTPPDEIEVESTRVACDGGAQEQGALGHPKVWLEIGADGFVECPYCGRRYVAKAGAGGH